MLRLRRDIPLFPGAKKKAFTLSYDDGVSQDKRFIELLNKYELKCTFNINSGLLRNRDWLKQPELNVRHFKLLPDEIRTVYAGHEVAIHTLTHPDLTTIPKDMVSYEVISDRANLESLLEMPVRGMAYPFGTYNDTVTALLKDLGIAYARTVQNTEVFDLPENFLKWHPTCHHINNNIFHLLQEFIQLYNNDTKYRKPQVFYVWGHTYEFDGRGDWDRIETFMQGICQKEDIWYATNIEIVDYMRAVEQLQYSVNGEYIKNPTRYDIWMNIDDIPYKMKSGEIVHIPNIR